MNMLNKIFSASWRIWRWHPEVAIRYLPIVKEIKNIACQPTGKEQNYKARLKILEVGSGWLGISPYLGEEIIGLDEDFEEKKYNLLKQVKGNILNIPFENNSFDVVICVDVLEHLSFEKRAKAVEELFRVAKKFVFLGVPCGRESQKLDSELDKQYQKIFGQSFPFLKQHLEFGLPQESELVQAINKISIKLGRRVELAIKGNENLSLRRILLRGWLTKSLLVNILFRKAMLPLIPFFLLLDRPPYYRKLFFVKIKS